MYKVNMPNIIKPVSGLNFKALNSSALALGLGTVIDNQKDNFIKKDLKNQENEDKEISLLDFSRMYRIGQIPVMDFVIVYIILYCLNYVSSVYNYNYKFILIATIPITLVFNLLTNKDLKVSWTIIIILILSSYYLLSSSIQNL
jgi:hypothetical protein